MLLLLHRQDLIMETKRALYGVRHAVKLKVLVLLPILLKNLEGKEFDAVDEN